MAVMTDTQLVNKVKDIANNYKTLYVYGCFGAPMNATNKQRYTNNYSYNKQASRKSKIMAASSNTFGFDCVNLIKGVLWGWNGNVNATYGGAKYNSNGVPDTNANGMFDNYCTDKSSDFSNIVPGEFVWLEGHIGVYIGNGLVVECTPIWKDGVQVTACGNIGSKKGYNTRTWKKHGKSKFIQYTGGGSSFLPARGYFKKGDSGKNVEKICSWFEDKVKGNYFGDYLEACVKVYQKQNGLEQDGNIGPITLASMKKNGFKE